jgi:hypothetical protein
VYICVDVCLLGGSNCCTWLDLRFIILHNALVLWDDKQQVSCWSWRLKMLPGTLRLTFGPRSKKVFWLIFRRRREILAITFWLPCTMSHTGIMRIMESITREFDCIRYCWYCRSWSLLFAADSRTSSPRRLRRKYVLYTGNYNVLIFANRVKLQILKIKRGVLQTLPGVYVWYKHDFIIKPADGFVSWKCHCYGSH